ncbi:ring-cleaving dioxygenase [Carnobacterium divergens]|uniref:ring-cleaving dioxygenase n=1 Tax=Carnobacterium divergens TaxID=2748 RepID=UPI001072A589|nr:ring-cleaving dioxygenase [Carnobacterium divergens]TFJ40741.1 ring-cleaving dioxygenase [Carnobacterium divergens]TFJ49429.1 ring-cleaving dioxygenase [Carnobacterium divergens]TFJ54796.1 ring-cleaving dioxygenase [Carnobacterium divergens]TFJ61007.1 ring-cleaving dioxygenase [Carnobacterium divergens]TFJ71147.1 ring-cleaving dioxygenase [Carnobacterium divergens]
MKKSLGIHHITAIVGNPQENVDFYASVLGLRLVKKTINFDDPQTYHLYFGDDGANPGSILTFFPWPNAYNGKKGAGQVEVISFMVPKNSLTFWENRLHAYQIETHKEVRFDESYLTFSDPHGLKLEIVERESSQLNQWNFNGVAQEVAIIGFAGATLNSRRPERTGELLENTMGLEKIAENETHLRFKSTSEIGNTIEVLKKVAERGTMGSGTVHHIAFRAKDASDQLEWKQVLSEDGYQVTPVQDRNYFEAIYFREKGEILFEIATDTPGFAHDESPETMGESLMLPEWYEPQREQIQQVLPAFTVRETKPSTK